MRVESRLLEICCCLVEMSKVVLLLLPSPWMYLEMSHAKHHCHCHLAPMLTCWGCVTNSDSDTGSDNQWVTSRRIPCAILQLHLSLLSINTAAPHAFGCAGSRDEASSPSATLTWSEAACRVTRAPLVCTCRSNGLPVYNFCVAIDDALMGITHVLRAEEHLPNTLRQVHRAATTCTHRPERRQQGMLHCWDNDTRHTACCAHAFSLYLTRIYHFGQHLASQLYDNNMSSSTPWPWPCL